MNCRVETIDRTIVVGYDGADRARDALALGELLARTEGAQLIVAHIHLAPARVEVATRTGSEAMTADVLVAYATKHGHTRLVAERIGAVLREAGLTVELRDLQERRADPLPAGYAGVLVAASVHAARHQKRVVQWAKGHAATLAACPTAFVSVSLTAADDTDEARTETHRLIDELADESGWTPGTALPVAGALQYREYDLPTRVLMRLIARQHHAPTDVSRDVDFTDWPAVERFAQAFATRVARQPTR